jgi:hypothetical protein
MKILFHLVSGQNSQVYFADKFYKPDENVFFYTTQSKKNLPALHEAMKKCIKVDVEIHPFEYGKIRRVITETVDSYAQKTNELILNFTGGTKIQSVVLFDAAKERGLKAIYVNSEQHHILEIGASHPVRHSTLDLDIQPIEYLLVNGQKVKEEVDKISKYSDEITNVLTTHFSSFSKFILGFAKLEPLKYNYPVSREGEKLIAGSKYKFSPTSFYLKLMLNQKILFEAEEKPGRQLVEDVTGKWLEKAVYKKILESGLFGVVNMNVKIAYKTKDYKNEFDILAMKGTDLCLFEVKSGSVKASDIDQLVALRKMLGTYTRLFVVAFFKPNATIQERLNEYNITFLLFQNLENELKQISLYNPNI